MVPEGVDRDRTFLAGVTVGGLDERVLEVAGLPTGASSKVLSRAGDGSVSQLVSAPGGWNLGEGRRVSALTEIFVLVGTLRVDNQRLGHYGYLRIPAGTRISGIAAGPDGAKFLLFSNGRLEFESVSGVSGTAGLEAQHLQEMSWIPSTTPGIAPGLLHKRLAEDPETGARTWIIGLIHWGGEITKWETHPCAEEVFFLEGGMTNGEVFPDGRIRMIDYAAGGYFYRPADIGHSGPGSGTDTYLIGLCRSSSTMAVDWHEDPPPFPAGLTAIDFGKVE